MANKAEILMHPVRMRICQALIRNKDEGLTPLEMVKIIKDIPQATLYRHIQVLLDAGVIRIIKEKKIRSVSQKYYVLNEAEMKLSTEEWKQVSNKKKLDYISYYQLSLLTQYQNYLTQIEEQKRTEDQATFALVELKLADEQFMNFQNELNDLMLKYYQTSNQNHERGTPVRTIAVTIIPES
ncbi:helix-turn-helix domain-containing protein [Paenibacillus sp. KN14-4R]|uniref:helix-turn-helix domain-containing protein n=1 Tax=Paenibacillus sp. KN14-4R TaxID=3445773 RepID=UPI003FA0D009